MSGKKRQLDDGSNTHKSKKTKLLGGVKTNHEGQASLLSEEVDFPRGGGTSFTPLEVKAIQAEAIKEADEELFEVGIWLSVVSS
jgi:rRNA biogenesis protein RRP5